MFKSIQSRESFMQNETITSAYIGRKEEDMYVGKTAGGRAAVSFRSSA